MTARGLSERHLPRKRATAGAKASVDRVNVVASATGNRADELAAQAALTVDAAGIKFAAAGGDGRPGMTGSLSSMRLTAAAGQPTTLSLDGTVAGHPLALEASAATLAKLLPTFRAPFQAAGRFAGVDISAKGILPVEGIRKGEPLTMRADAKSLDTLSNLLDTRLPPLGPAFVEASILELGSDKQSADVLIGLGESRAQGRVTRRLNGTRLHSSSIFPRRC